VLIGSAGVLAVGALGRGVPTAGQPLPRRTAGSPTLNACSDSRDLRIALPGEESYTSVAVVEHEAAPHTLRTGPAAVGDEQDRAAFVLELRDP